MTVIMGVGGNLPLALAAGLGLNAVVAFQIAPLMSWDDAMGLVVLEGLLICVLVVTGLREAVMHAIPQPLKQAISVGIGLFIAFIGFVDAGFVSRIPDVAKTTVPVQLGATGTLSGWPILVFCLGVLLTIGLLARKVKGAILISIVTMTVVAIVDQRGRRHQELGPDHAGAARQHRRRPRLRADRPLQPVRRVRRDQRHHRRPADLHPASCRDFFDTMGTVVGITAEAGPARRGGQGPEPRPGPAHRRRGGRRGRRRLLVLRDLLHRVRGRRRRGRAHRLRQPGHRRPVRGWRSS